MEKLQKGIEYTFREQKSTIEIKRDVIFTRSEGKESKEEKRRSMYLIDSVTSIQTEEENWKPNSKKALEMKQKMNTKSKKFKKQREKVKNTKLQKKR